MRTYRTFISLIHFISILPPSTLTLPQAFPTSGNGLWYTQPGNIWSKNFLPVGNGYLAAMVPGETTLETTQLNIESLWSGGPFADPSYNGGNKMPSEQAATARIMQKIRQTIFQSSSGDIDEIEALTTNPGEYGSYAGAGHLLSSINTTGPVTNYARWLDLDQGLARTSWTQNGDNILRTTFCSHPSRACIEHIESSSTLPTIIYAFTSDLEPGLPIPNVTCLSSNSMLVRGQVSQSPPSMAYALVFHAYTSSVNSQIQCIQSVVTAGSPPNATLQVAAGTSEDTEAWITWMGDTEYDMDAGDAAHGFSFRGVDPVTKLFSSSGTSSASCQDYQSALIQHTTDIHNTLYATFALDLGHIPVLDVPSDVLKSTYTIDGPTSNAYIEWVLFNYGRYLLASSSRGTLPANLQGKWANGISNAWSSDYHSNINIQMNYWCAETTGLSSLTIPLFDYIEKTWAPRGAETAHVLYNISRGWVTHNQMNVFGHTGMSGGGNRAAAQWADYPESAVWMMIHAWDHFDYTNDIGWWITQGWPLVKGVASFHLDNLIADLHFNDSTLVVNPCNSPEQVPITFGCAHSQQLIWQLFNAVEKGFDASGDTDTGFLTEIISKRAQMDKGLKIGSWGQLQEWKVEKDSPTDTHRHLSHLIGLYPGYAITSFDPSAQGTGPAKGYSKNQILDAAAVSLYHRGNGTGLDADSGWEKAWRAAAWAQLGNSSMFYHELSFAVHENFGSNLFSLYNPYDPDPIFQIDANLGFPGAVMNALLQAPDVPSLTAPLVITLLPALPVQWPSGSIRGARVRGSISIDMQWKEGKLTGSMLTVDSSSNVRQRPVRVVYNSRVLASFDSEAGMEKRIL